LFDKSKEVYDKVSQGENAAKEGKNLAEDISAYFSDIKDTCSQTDTDIGNCMRRIESLIDKFIQVQKQIENMASLSEENAASVEEILATVENDNDQILAINTAIKEIDEMCSKLAELVEAN
jgi:methyl-accepting chemotaxis protein